MNPLFPDEPDQTGSDADHGKDKHYLLPGRNGKTIQPRGDSKWLPLDSEPGDTNLAAELIRKKLDALYEDEPNARQEAAESETAAHRSKHQQYMYELSTSGKSLAEIQTAWHNYYINLPDAEKHQVWQEFYEANDRTPTAYSRYVEQHHPKSQAEAPAKPAAPPAEAAPAEPVVSRHADEPASADAHNFAALKQQALARVRTRRRAQQRAKQHAQSLAFGLGFGALVVVIFLFSFFNQLVIAPLIQPGAHATSTPIILSSDSIAPSATPEVIIPKINVELPIVYGSSTNENVIETALEQGVIHYPTTSVPGQSGNAAFFGHSSNNIFNKGKYKFAFVLLHELAPGDLFYLTYGGKVYGYKVYAKRIVQPTDTWVLNNVNDRPATVTLITCDPPGTSLHRLVVWGEQISPDPTGNAIAATPAQPASTSVSQLADNGPSLWSRFWHWATPW